MAITPELIAAIVGILTALLVSYNNAQNNKKLKLVVKKDAVQKDKKLDEIHVLVDGRLSEAIKEIADLKERLAILTGSQADAALAIHAATAQKGDDAIVKKLEEHIESVELKQKK